MTNSGETQTYRYFRYAITAIVVVGTWVAGHQFGVYLVGAEPPAREYGRAAALSGGAGPHHECAAGDRACSSRGAELPESVGIIGSGRMGTHLAAALAAAGVRVTLAARSESNARSVVEALVTGDGLRRASGVMVPPFNASAIEELVAGTPLEAAARDVVLLVTPYSATDGVVSQVASALAEPRADGKPRVVLDLTNPWYSGDGLPAEGPQSAVLHHKGVFERALRAGGANGVEGGAAGTGTEADGAATAGPSTGEATVEAGGDASVATVEAGAGRVSWGVAFKDILWSKILPQRVAGLKVKIAGEADARSVAHRMSQVLGFVPVMRGGLQDTPKLEPGRPKRS